jgi:hypothetical protein
MIFCVIALLTKQNIKLFALFGCQGGRSSSSKGMQLLSLSLPYQREIAHFYMMK